MATALVTVTAPVVALPTAERSAAVTAVAAASEMVMTTSVSSVTMLVRFAVAAPAAARLARVSETPPEKFPVALAVDAMAAPCAAVTASVTVAVEAEPRTTREAAVTRAAVTSV